MAVLREVRGQRDLQRLGLADVQRRRSRPGRRAISDRRRCRSRTAPPRRAIAPAVWAPSTSIGRPVASWISSTGSKLPVCQDTCERAISRVLGVTWARMVSSARSERLRPHRGHPHGRLRGVERAQQPEVLGVGRDDLVLGPQAQPGQDDVAAVRRGRGQREVLGRHADRRGQTGAHPLPQLEHRVDVRQSAAPQLEVGELLGRHRLDRRAGQRAHRAGVQVRDLVEDGELRAGFLEVHRLELDGRVVRQQHAVSEAPLVGPDLDRGGFGTANGDVVDPGPGLRVAVEHPVRCHGVEVARDHDRVGGPRQRLDQRHRAPQLGRGDPGVSERPRGVQVGDDEAVGQAHDLADAPFLPPGQPGDQVEPEPVRLLPPERRRVQHERPRAGRRGGRRRGGWRCPGRRTPSGGAPGSRSVSRRPRPAVIGIGPSRGRCATSPTAVMPLQRAELVERPGRHLLEDEHVGTVGAGQPNHLLEVRPTSPAARCSRGRGSSSGPA